MLTNDEKDQIRACVEALKAGLEGFRTRRAQLEMMAVVSNALGSCREFDQAEIEEEIEAGGGASRAGPNIAVVEAGTGTGKTLGYLVPALALAKSRAKHLVVSSSTVALQEQLCHKDAPALQRVLAELGLNFSFAVAKGRGRYACAAKLMEEGLQARQRDLDDLGDQGDEPCQTVDEGDDGDTDAENAPSPHAPALTALVEVDADATRVARASRPSQVGDHKARTMAIIGDLADAFEAQRWSGERDDLKLPVADEVWDKLVTDRQGCAGSHCPSFARCPFYLARQRVREADLVIANHDLVLASLEMDAGSVLPDPAETFYVFDEAHTLSTKIVDHLAARHCLKGAVEWVQSLSEAVRDAVLGLKLDAAFHRDARAHAQILTAALLALHGKLHATRAFEERRARRFKDSALPAWARESGTQALKAALGMQQTLAGLREQMLERAQAEPHLVQQLLANLGFFLGKLERLIDTWVLMLADEQANDSRAEQPAHEGLPQGSPCGPIARWVERHDSGHDPARPPQLPADYLICASPLMGADKLRRLLWRRVSGAVVTSATLSSCGRFDLFLEQSGLKPLRDLKLLQVASPFDYASRAQLVVPAMASDPKDADEHTQEVAKLLPQLVSTAGTLVLFASGKQMKAVHALIPETLRQRVLMQGSLPKMEMLARHRAAIDGGERSVLFGLTSLAEGVDLPGEYCTHVICAKLPFSVPDSPLEEARREFVQAQGRSAFMEITVPEAGVRLQQIAGRLMRTVDDHGRVTVLDKRLVTRHWGQLLMRGLPPFERVIGERVIDERGIGRVSNA